MKYPGETESFITLASRNGHLDTIKWLVIEKGFSLQAMNHYGTCLMNACELCHIDCIIWMLSNGSSLAENTKLDYNGNILTSKSGEEILKLNGFYEDVQSMLTSKN